MEFFVFLLFIFLVILFILFIDLFNDFKNLKVTYNKSFDFLNLKVSELKQNQNVILDTLVVLGTERERRLNNDVHGKESK